MLLQSVALLFSKKAGLASVDQGPIYLIINPWYALSIFSLLLQAVSWVLVLRKLELSLAYPCMSLVFPLNLIVSFVFFQEEIDLEHVLGVLAVIVGVILISGGREKEFDLSEQSD